MNPSKVAVLLLVLPSLTLAQVCTKIEDAAERLACYDEQNRVSSPAPAERQAPPPTPVEEARAPAPVEEAQAPAPVEEAQAPVEEAQAPVEEAQAPVEEAQAPVEEAQAPTPGIASETIIEAESPEEFGQQEPFDAPKEYIEATIVEIAKPGAFSYLRLDNGQVWRETQYSRVRFKEGRKVTITEGILNSFDLKMEGYNKIVKVRRVR